MLNPSTKMHCSIIYDILKFTTSSQPIEWKQNWPLGDSNITASGYNNQEWGNNGFFPKNCFSYFLNVFWKIFNFSSKSSLFIYFLKIKMIIFVLCPCQDLIAASRSSCPLSRSAIPAGTTSLTHVACTGLVPPTSISVNCRQT